MRYCLPEPEKTLSFVIVGGFVPLKMNVLNVELAKQRVPILVTFGENSQTGDEPFQFWKALVPKTVISVVFNILEVPNPAPLPLVWAQKLSVSWVRPVGITISCSRLMQ
jgi:hypothetical protein